MSAAAPFKTGFRAQPRLPCRGMTLVELLVVVAIIATLIGLLLPAVQAARESSRRSKCLANLRQIALACLMHETAQGALPTGGWGGAWVGDPDRGFDDRQPGGWVFNILDYAEEPALRAAGAGELSGHGKAEQVRRRLAAPLSLFVCSSRHEPLGNIVLEAWAANKPVVAAAAAGPVSLIGENEAGLLVPLEDAGALAQGVLKLTHEPELAARLAAEGLSRFEREYTEDAVVAKYLSFFESVR